METQSLVEFSHHFKHVNLVIWFTMQAVASLVYEPLVT